MSEGKARLQLQCRGCDTVYEVCDLPINVFEIVKHIRAAKCPTCAKSSSKADVYVGEKHESEGA